MTAAKKAGKAAARMTRETTAERVADYLEKKGESVAGHEEGKDGLPGTVRLGGGMEVLVGDGYATVTYDGGGTLLFGKSIGEWARLPAEVGRVRALVARRRENTRGR